MTMACYLIRKPCYPSENWVMPPTLSYIFYFLEF